MDRRVCYAFFYAMVLFTAVPVSAQIQNRFESGRLMNKLSDRDNDSIPDANDRCPDEWGYREYEGCRERQPEPGFMRFEVQPSDVNITVAQKNLTGDTVISITEGIYTCSFTAPGHIDTMLSINVPPAGTIIVQMEMRKAPGTFLISSTPTGATILTGSERHLGATPIRGDWSEGRYEFVLKYSGYSDTSFYVDVVSADTHHVDIHMTYKQPFSYSVTSDNKDYSSSHGNNSSRRASRATGSSIVGKYIIDDAMAFAIDPISLLLKFPLNKDFKEFKDGFSGGFFLPDNYRSLAYANSYSLSFFNLHLNLELGQWANRSGEKSNKEPIDDEMYTINEEPDNLYQITDIFVTDDRVYAFVSATSSANSSRGDYNTRFQIKSTAASVGLSLPINRVRFMYAMGLQWEDLIIKNALALYADRYEFVDIVFDNDYAFHQFRCELLPVELRDDIGMGIYCDYRHSFGGTKRTGWGILRIGTTFRIGDLNNERN